MAGGRCDGCGTKLSAIQRFRAQTLCPSCSAILEAEKRSAEGLYDGELLELIASSSAPADVKRRLEVLVEKAQFSPEELEARHRRAFEHYLQLALSDDHLTDEEEARMLQVAAVLGIDQKTFDSEFKAFKPQLMISRINSGTLPILDNPRTLLRRGEVAHIEVKARLLKEVTVRTPYLGGYSGFSFRLAKGVRYHLGGAMGGPVTLGTKLQTEDEGTLTVTSQRTLFSGFRRTIEMPYGKLLNLTVFMDGVQFQLSNRKNPPLFQVAEGLSDLLAAIVNTAAQKHLS